MIQTILHYSLHFLFPGLLAFLLFRKDWKLAWLLMILTMVIDLDHLLASPIYQANRCSINFHPLHTYWAALLYISFLFLKKTRIIGVGLLFHLFADYLDCLLMD